LNPSTSEGDGRFIIRKHKIEFSIVIIKHQTSSLLNAEKNQSLTADGFNRYFSPTSRRCAGGKVVRKVLYSVLFRHPCGCRWVLLSFQVHMQVKVFTAYGKGPEASNNSAKDLNQ